MFCQNIIGRAMSIRSGNLRGHRILGHHRTFPLLDQPARQQPRGPLFHVLVQQFQDFLAQIRRVTESRQLIRLQGSPRSGQQKFPGRGGDDTEGNLLPESRSDPFWHINAIVIRNEYT
jgi:hypothetical protein